MKIYYATSGHSVKLLSVFVGEAIQSPLLFNKKD